MVTLGGNTWRTGHCIMSMYGQSTLSVSLPGTVIARWIFWDKQEFNRNSTEILPEFKSNSWIPVETFVYVTVQIKLETWKAQQLIYLCYSRHLIFTGIQNYQNSVYRNSCLFNKIHRDRCFRQILYSPNTMTVLMSGIWRFACLKVSPFSEKVIRTIHVVLTNEFLFLES